MARAAIPHLKRGASIINTGSVVGLEGSAELLDYAATKGAIHAFTKSLAQNLLEQGIRVNAVAPGPVWTPLNPADRPAEEVAEFGRNSDMKRAAQPEEISPAFVYPRGAGAALATSPASCCPSPAASGRSEPRAGELAASAKRRARRAVRSGRRSGARWPWGRRALPLLRHSDWVRGTRSRRRSRAERSGRAGAPGMPVASPAPMNPFVRRYAAPVACVVALALAPRGAATRVLYDGAEPAVLLLANRHLGARWVTSGRSRSARRSCAPTRGIAATKAARADATLLTDAAGRVRRGLTRSDVEWALQSAPRALRRAGPSSCPQSTPLIEVFDAEKCCRARAAVFAQEDAKRVREHLSGSPAKRERERVKAIVKRFEEWTGPLNEAQAGLVRTVPLPRPRTTPSTPTSCGCGGSAKLVTLLDRAVREDSAAPVDAPGVLFDRVGAPETAGAAPAGRAVCRAPPSAPPPPPPPRSARAWSSG